MVELSEFEYEVIRRGLFIGADYYDKAFKQLSQAQYVRNFSDVAEDAAICWSAMHDLLRTKFCANPEIKQVVPMTRGLYFRSH